MMETKHQHNTIIVGGGNTAAGFLLNSALSDMQRSVVHEMDMDAYAAPEPPPMSYGIDLGQKGKAIRKAKNKQQRKARRANRK
jgi:hypothetical protein